MEDTVAVEAAMEGGRQSNTYASTRRRPTPPRSGLHMFVAGFTFITSEKVRSALREDELIPVLLTRVAMHKGYQLQSLELPRGDIVMRPGAMRDTMPSKLTSDYLSA